jgi:hypothetical protein
VGQLSHLEGQSRNLLLILPSGLVSQPRLTLEIFLMGCGDGVCEIFPGLALETASPEGISLDVEIPYCGRLVVSVIGNESVSVAFCDHSVWLGLEIHPYGGSYGGRSLDPLEHPFLSSDRSYEWLYQEFLLRCP